MGLSLTVLGCAATFPRPGNPCSGYLVRTDQTAVWVDCGPGTFAALQEHREPTDLDALWVSHLHPDHCADLLSVFNWLANTPDLARLPVYGPPGWAGRVAAMLPAANASHLVHQAFDVNELHDHHSVQIGDVEMQSRAVEHGVPSFGLRVEHNGKALAYSGDTGPCPALIQVARDADLLICETGAIEPQRAHCTPSEAGRAAANARSRRLMLTHLAHGLNETRAKADAVQVAGCPVEIAQPGMHVELI